MYYSLNSLKGVIRGIILGSIIGVIRGDTRSLDYCSYEVPLKPNKWTASSAEKLPPCFLER